MLNSTLALAVPALYLAAALLIWRHARHPHLESAESVPRWRRSAAPAVLALGGLLLHAQLLRHTVFAQSTPNLSLFQAGSLFAFQLVLVLMLAAVRVPVESLGLLALPLAAALVALSLLTPSAPTNPVMLDWQVEMHIVLATLAYSLLALAAAQAVLIWLQDRLLRRHRPTLLARVPPLETMDALLFQMVLLGFFLLSLALLSGLLFVDDLFAQHLAHKTLLSLLAWLLFATLLWGRWRHGWRGQRAVRWTLGGGLTLTLAYFGSKLILELVLGRQWS